MGFYFLDDLNTWGGADLRPIIECYLILVALVFAYFLADDEPDSAPSQARKLHHTGCNSMFAELHRFWAIEAYSHSA